MLITVLLRKPWRAEWQPAEVVSELGYTGMTLSRAVKELTAPGLATLRIEGRARWLHAERTAAETCDRAKPGIKLVEGSHLTPIPLDEAVASLSAILLDDEYYEFILAGRREVDGLPWVGEDRLIPLKASAWLDLGERQAKGAPIDTKNIRKHANDVPRLSQLLAPDTRIPVVERIAQDLTASSARSRQIARSI